MIGTWYIGLDEWCYTDHVSILAGTIRFMENPFALNSETLSQLYDRYTSAVESYDWHYQEKSAEFQKYYPELKPLTSSQFKLFIENAFWGSLKHEEGRFHEFSLLLHPVEPLLHKFIFDQPVLFDADNLAKLAPALDPLANCILVWPDETGELFIRGFAPLKDTGLMTTTIAPGQILVSFKEIGIQYFSTLITGTRQEFVASSEFLTWLVPEAKNKRRMDILMENEKEFQRAVDYRDITADMRAHQHGGILLIVNEESDWRGSLVQPMTYSGEPYYKVRYDLMERDRREERVRETEPLWTDSPWYRMAVDSARKSIRTIGRLTAVDGATIVTYDLDVLAFGAKIKQKENEKPEMVSISEPFENSSPKDIQLSRFHGTRHQSTAQFVFDQRDALAFVASQDGNLSVMRWDPEKAMVSIIRPAEFALL